MHLMAIYYISQHYIRDRAVFEDYLNRNYALIEAAGGSYVSSSASPFLLEGTRKPDRVAIVKFPDMAAVRRWYDSPEYQPLKAIRQSVAETTMLLLESQ
jgi:uncharacterized protein (DUF1330 family)